ncbi:MAG: hypoxanthine phosphoribosyltransferase [Oscillospiraceae bacterium]
MNAVGLKCEKLDKIKRVVISAEDIAKKTAEAGELISREYEGKPLLLVSILKGAYIFLADLSRQISIPCEVGFMAAESYGDSTTSSGDVKITLDLKQDISQYHVIIVEDIVDSGRTLSKIVEMLKKRDPLSLKVYSLLDKPERRAVDFKPDYTLFTIPDFFAVGYGLDCGEYYRNLPYIAEYDPN